MNIVSAYEKIKANIGSNGRLPHTFSLEEKPAPNKVGFMPGAMDGIDMYHSSIGDEGKASSKVIKLLKKFFKSRKQKYLVGIEAVLVSNRAISLIDHILSGIRDGHKSMTPTQVFESSMALLKTSNNTELIKIGISLFGLFDLSSNDEALEVVTTLALYEDFTLYAVVAVSNWVDGNEMIFQIAKNVVGWGKIHAVERLEPDTCEIREWILRNGCSNSVMEAYLGLVCANKGDLISALRKETLDDDLFLGIGVIIDAMLDEGPARGISVYEYAEEAMTRFLYHAQKLSSEVQHFMTILNIRMWAETAEIPYKDEVLSLCAGMIDREDWKGKIIKTLQMPNDDYAFYCAANVANRLNIDISSELFATVKELPLQYSFYIPQLMKKSELVNEIISLCEAILPLEEMAEGMGDFLFSDKLGQEHQCLDWVLPELAEYPLQGTRLIKTGLNSRVVRGRNMACKALTGWVQKLNKPLIEISPELYNELNRICDTEINEQAKENMLKLLNHS